MKKLNLKQNLKPERFPIVDIESRESEINKPKSEDDCTPT